MSDFISGVEEKYPSALLKGRKEIEGNVISCFCKDMLCLDESKLTDDDFITQDGRFYFTLLRKLREKGYSYLDEVTILSSFSDDVVGAYEDRGGWEQIQHLTDIVNEQNFGTYLDNLYRENTLLNMSRDGFNLEKKIILKNGKEVIPLQFFRTLSAEEVTDWYTERISEYGVGTASKILEEGSVEFDDEFIDSCEDGLSSGIPFDFAGEDVNGEKMRCFPFLSNQTIGLLEGRFHMLGGFSSTGKSTWWITPIMSFLSQGRKVLIISNEETIDKFKIKFLMWILYKHNRYFKLTKKKLSSGVIDEESREQIKIAQQYWMDQGYKDRCKVIALNDADMSVVKKKVREYVLRYGYDTVLYDTFKIQEADYGNTRQDLSLVRDSRELDKLAKKYNIIMLASVQLAEAMKGQLFLSALVVSNSKQIKEILETFFLMRAVYDEELDSHNKYYCHPFQSKQVDGVWKEVPVELDRSLTYRMLFVEKNRNGDDSPSTGIAYLFQFDGNHCVFKEIAKCRPKHGEIR